MKVPLPVVAMCVECNMGLRPEAKHWDWGGQSAPTYPLMKQRIKSQSVLLQTGQHGWLPYIQCNVQIASIGFVSLFFIL